MINLEKSQILIGPEHQAQIPRLLRVLPQNYQDKDECFWHAEDNAKIDSEEFDQFVDATGLPIDQALKLHISSNFSTREAFSRIEEYEKSQNQGKKWSNDEKERFISLLNKIGKNFDVISRKLNNRNVKECVELYYELKTERCLTSNSTKTIDQCPQMCRNLNDQGTTAKSECQNCRQKLWRYASTVVFDAEHGQLPLCAACGLYARKFGVHRPLASIDPKSASIDEEERKSIKHSSTCLLSKSAMAKVPMAVLKNKEPKNAKAIVNTLKTKDVPNFQRFRQKYSLDYLSASLEQDTSNSIETSLLARKRKMPMPTQVPMKASNLLKETSNVENGQLGKQQVNLDDIGRIFDTGFERDGAKNGRDGCQLCRKCFKMDNAN